MALFLVNYILHKNVTLLKYRLNKIYQKVTCKLIKIILIFVHVYLC